ncbi:MAG: hypothetical protein ACOX6Y_06170 [Christensenellales bacterium]
MHKDWNPYSLIELKLSTVAVRPILALVTAILFSMILGTHRMALILLFAFITVQVSILIYLNTIDEKQLRHIIISQKLKILPNYDELVSYKVGGNMNDGVFQNEYLEIYNVVHAVSERISKRAGKVLNFRKSAGYFIRFIEAIFDNSFSKRLGEQVKEIKKLKNNDKINPLEHVRLRTFALTIGLAANKKVVNNDSELYQIIRNELDSKIHEIIKQVILICAKSDPLKNQPEPDYSEQSKADGEFKQMMLLLKPKEKKKLFLLINEINYYLWIRAGIMVELKDSKLKDAASANAAKNNASVNKRKPGGREQVIDLANIKIEYDEDSKELYKALGIGNDDTGGKGNNNYYDLKALNLVKKAMNIGLTTNIK